MTLLRWNLSKLLALAFVIRVLLIFYGEWQDSNMLVKYTDVDYKVFNDAALAVKQGRSPYSRTTYRYTPLLAYIMLINIDFHESSGKLLFCLTDLGIAFFLYKILYLRKTNTEVSLFCISLWLFHPFSINISTRGNADSVVVFLVLASLYLILQKRVVFAAIMYGLAVHFKMYPIVYALSFIKFLDHDLEVPSTKHNTSKYKTLFYSFFNRNRICFGIVSGSVFLILTLIFYLKYGYTFLYETYFYHFVRTDNRHNFSIYFYDLYLRYNTPVGFGVGLLAFLPQIVLIVATSLLYGKDLPFALFLHTFTFVIFNKVCTAQYFVWYTGLLPLILPACGMKFWSKWIYLIGLWFVAELNWLYWAYYLEFEGVNTFYAIWLSGLLFFSVNIWILVEILRNTVSKPVYSQGIIVPFNAPPICTRDATKQQ